MLRSALTLNCKYKEDANGVKAGVVMDDSGVARVVFDKGGEESPVMSVHAGTVRQTLTSRYKYSCVCSSRSEILSR